MATVKRFVKYGDRKMAIEDGLSLAQIKSIMARHFPELADPEVKTDTKGDETVYTFTKKAGKKGARTPHARALAGLLVLEPSPVVPDLAVQYSTGTMPAVMSPVSGDDLTRLAEHVATTRQALLTIRPLPAGDGELL